MKISKLFHKSPLSRLDSELLLLHILKRSKEWLFTHPDHELTDEELEKFQKLEQRRLSGVSVAALLGVKEFFGLDFEVNEHVLVPRPETEILVEEIISLVKSPLNPSLKGGKLRILDVGTGSGCIAIAVKKNLPQCEVAACDISPEALDAARKNAKKHDVEIEFLESDLLERVVEPPAPPPLSGGQPDVIVANLPYVPLGSDEVEPGVKKFEPDLALFGGVDGLDVIRKLLTQISQLEQKPEYVLLEFAGCEQTDVLKNFSKELFPESKIDFKKDLAGINRVLRIDSFVTQ